MSDPKGFRLYVNLSAANAKQRLKGFGHGVKKVHSAGKKQAVVIHTATDRHLDELQSLFSDVGCSTREDELSQPIENLRNLGVVSGQWLRDAGISTVADLERIGASAAYQMIRRSNSGASLNLLWAMAAGLDGRDWRDLSAAEKDQLRASVEDVI